MNTKNTIATIIASFLLVAGGFLIGRYRFPHTVYVTQDRVVYSPLVSLCEDNGGVYREVEDKGIEDNGHDYYYKIFGVHYICKKDGKEFLWNDYTRKFEYESVVSESF